MQTKMLNISKTARDIKFYKRDSNSKGYNHTKSGDSHFTTAKDFVTSVSEKEVIKSL